MELHVVHSSLSDLENFLAERYAESIEEVRDTDGIVPGGRYVDAVTGFSGVATSVCLNLHSETMVHLENENNSRWIEEKRLRVWQG